MALAIRNALFDDSRLPHKTYAAAVQLIVAAIPSGVEYVTFDELRAAAPKEVADELNDGVLSQILIDLGSKVLER